MNWILSLTIEVNDKIEKMYETAPTLGSIYKKLGAALCKYKIIECHIYRDMK